MNQKNEKKKYGQVYKDGLIDIPGGYGFIAWDTFNCLQPIECITWLKICEMAYKTTEESGIITLNERWFEKNFATFKDWNDAILAVLRLENKGYITCQFYKDHIDAKINYENIHEIASVVGRDRRRGLFLTKVCDDISKATASDIHKVSEVLLREKRSRGYDGLEYYLKKIHHD